MMDLRTALLSLRQDLLSIYDAREAAQVGDLVMEKITGWSRSERSVHQNENLTDGQLAEWRRCREELLRWRPVQYVLGEAWFAGMCFAVDERALIPRPETEELVDWIAAEMKVRMHEGRQDPLRRTWRILDIGTGSGCIPIALKKKLPEAEVWALDLSAAALELARHNATVLGAEIAFVERDIFDRGGWDSLPAFDLIVSNPPYVPEGDKAAMHRNVLDHEPHLALFVTGDDPLLFYREIAAFAKSRLDPGGLLFFEIHERMGAGIRTLLKRAGYTRVEVRQDMQGKERMSKGESPAPADRGA